MKTDLLDIRHMDCMDLMREFPDKHFDLAIVDPPYFEHGGNPQYYNPTMAKSTSIKPISAGWHLPDERFFAELLRVARESIIWGCNYYAKHIEAVGRIVWHKETSGDYSDCELASCSLQKRVSYFKYRWNGMIQQDMKNKEVRHHPTQKPVALYNWLLANYAKPGQTILDTHLGSGSIAIACHYRGHHLTACELDADYYAAACERIERETRQTTLCI